MRSTVGVSCVCVLLAVLRRCSDVLEEPSPLPARLRNALTRALGQGAGGKPLQEAQMYTDSFRHVPNSVKLRIAGLAPKPGQLRVSTHEAAQEHGDVEKIFALLRHWLPRSLL